MAYFDRDTEVLPRAQLEALQLVGQRHNLTPFELITAAAFQAFAEAGVELAVLEVGLGGRLDATTVHPDRQVLALAAIGLDHTEHLGPTLAAIAAIAANTAQPLARITIRPVGPIRLAPECALPVARLPEQMLPGDFAIMGRFEWLEILKRVERTSPRAGIR